MPKMKTLFALMANLQDPDRAITKLRFDDQGSSARDGEIELVPMVVFQGDTQTLAIKDDLREMHAFPASTFLVEASLQALDPDPVIQSDGYYHLSKTQLLFLGSYYARVTMITLGYAEALQLILRQLENVSLTVHTQDDSAELPVQSPVAPLYVTYKVTDAELQAFARVEGSTLITVPLV